MVDGVIPLVVAAPERELVVEIDLDGKPITQGSKKAFSNPKTGRPIIVEDRSRDLKFWRGRIAELASAAMGDLPLIDAPVAIEMMFTLSRPKSLARKPMALPTTMPDLDKLARAVQDAMGDIVYRNDAQVVDLVLRKRYEGHPEARLRPGGTIRVYRLG